MDIIITIIFLFISWGMIPFLSVKLNFHILQPVYGISGGIFFFAIIFYFVARPEITAHIFLVGFVSGLYWAIAILSQYESLKFLSLPTMTLSSITCQLLGFFLLSSFIFAEWKDQLHMFFNLAAIILIILGLILIVSTSPRRYFATQQKNIVKGMKLILQSSLSFIIYLVLVFWQQVPPQSIILPQAIGLIAGILLLSDRKNILHIDTFRNMISGVIWATGNFLMLMLLPIAGMSSCYSLAMAGLGGSIAINIIRQKEPLFTIQKLLMRLGILLIFLAAGLISYMIIQLSL